MKVVSPPMKITHTADGWEVDDLEILSEDDLKALDYNSTIAYEMFLKMHLDHIHDEVMVKQLLEQHERFPERNVLAVRPTRGTEHYERWHAEARKRAGLT